MYKVPKQKAGICSLTRTPAFPFFGGAERDRTVDLLSARQALSQLSYSPIEVILRGLDSMAL